MAGWICNTCGWRHDEHDNTCTGCGQSGDELEQYVDCPDCGNEYRLEDVYCGCGYRRDEPDEFEDDDLD